MIPRLTRSLSLALLAPFGAPLAAQCASELLFDPNGLQEDRLGLSVAYDGTTLVAGGAANDFAGNVLVWRREGGTLVLEDTLVGLGGGVALPGDDFGRHVAVHGDRLAVASRASTAPGVLAVFERHTSGGSASWKQVAFWDLLVDPADSGGRIAISQDVVAYGDATDFTGIGAVYYATMEPGFSPLRRLVGDASFGRSVALAGHRLAVGAPFEGSQGIVRTFTLDADGYFVLEGTLLPPAGTSSPFGYNLEWGALAPVATLYVGMKDEPVFGQPGAGAIWEMKEQLQVFPQPPIWSPGASFHASSPVANGRFGHDFSVDFPPFGSSRLVAGAPAEGDGNLHLFERPFGGTWAPAGVVSAPDPGIGGNSVFANFVDHAGTTAVACHSNVDGPAGFDQGAIVVVSLDPQDCLLEADRLTLSQSAGGMQILELDLGPELAGDFYWIFGSASGTSPGIPLSGFVLPLFPDFYFVWSAQHANSSILVDTLGTLDVLGRATAAFSLPPGAPILATSYYHAAVTFRLDPLVHTSTTNAVEVTFLP